MERLIGQNLRVVLEKKGALDVAARLSHRDRRRRRARARAREQHRPSRREAGEHLPPPQRERDDDDEAARLRHRAAARSQGEPHARQVHRHAALRVARADHGRRASVRRPTSTRSALVLYEMLCGRGPFDDAGDAYAIGAAHAQQPAPPLSRFARVAPEVERLVASALAKDPAERPRDCFAFASELRRMLRDEEASPRSATAVNVSSAAAPSTHAGASQVVTGPTMHEDDRRRRGADAAEDAAHESDADGNDTASRSGAIAPTLGGGPAERSRRPSRRGYLEPRQHEGARRRARGSSIANAATRDSGGAGRDAPGSRRTTPTSKADVRDHVAVPAALGRLRDARVPRRPSVVGSSDLVLPPSIHSEPDRTARGGSATASARAGAVPSGRCYRGDGGHARCRRVRRGKKPWHRAWRRPAATRRDRNSAPRGASRPLRSRIARAEQHDRAACANSIAISVDAPSRDRVGSAAGGPVAPPPGTSATGLERRSTPSPTGSGYSPA